jgi:signal peptidase I
MRMLFLISAFVACMCLILMIGSVALETINGFPTFRISGGEMTITFSVPDRIFLSAALVSGLAASCAWLRISGRG